MEVLEIKKNEKIFEKGTPVGLIGVLINGGVRMTEGKYDLLIKNGSLIGIAEYPGDSYIFDYIATEDSKVAIYPYTDLTDVKKILKVNERISPIICSQTISMTVRSYETFESILSNSQNEYQKLLSDHEEYKELCRVLSEKERNFDIISTLDEPPKGESMQSWMIEMLRAMKENDEILQSEIYKKSIDLINGFIMGAGLFIRFEAEEGERLRKYLNDLREKTADFYNEFERIKKLSKSLSLDEENEDEEDIKEIKNASSVILNYAMTKPDIKEQFIKLLEEYKRYPDRSDMGDQIRKLRRSISDFFFIIYEDVFFKAISEEDEDNIPEEALMFLNFGFIDEEIAGEENTKYLYHLIKTRKADPSGVVITIFEWLGMIYDGKVMPSKNEFDLDYPSFLREQRQNGEITAEREKERLTNFKERTRFEIENMFKVADRMTFGRISSFVPIFDSINVMRPLDQAFIKNITLHNILDDHRKIDFSIFYRTKDYNNEDLKISHLEIEREILPYFILMPNYGIRTALWQEIDGKKRDTPARFVLPIFTAEDPKKSITGAFGEYRWEMEKTIQGVHWNDITEPSLTSEYADYIQYYRKNRNLNAEQKEKIKKLLQKVQNNLKRAFVSDYILYITSEKNGSPVMNKESRRILFSYIPFSKEIRDKIGTNPQYQEHIERYETKLQKKEKPLSNVLKRLEAHKEEIPRELLMQREYLNM